MFKYFYNHPGVAVTLTYLYLSFVGLIYQYFHLKSFGVNLFDFSSSNDYFLAFLKAVPFLLVLMFIYLLIFIKDVLFNQKHAPGKSVKERCEFLLFKTIKIEFFLLVVFLPFASAWVGKVRSNDLNSHNQIIIGEVMAKELGVSQNLYLFDATQNYLFLKTESKSFVLKRDRLTNFEVKSPNKSQKQEASQLYI